MRTNQWFPADLVTFTEEILNGKLYFLCGDVKQILEAPDKDFLKK